MLFSGRKPLQEKTWTAKQWLFPIHRRDFDEPVQIHKPTVIGRR